MPQSTVNQKVSSSFCSAQRSRQGLRIPNPQSQSFSSNFRSRLPTSQSGGTCFGSGKRHTFWCQNLKIYFRISLGFATTARGTPESSRKQSRRKHCHTAKIKRAKNRPTGVPFLHPSFLLLVVRRHQNGCRISAPVLERRRE